MGEFLRGLRLAVQVKFADGTRSDAVESFPLFRLSQNSQPVTEQDQAGLDLTGQDTGATSLQVQVRGLAWVTPIMRATGQLLIDRGRVGEITHLH
jgi:hypothetical protein